MVAGYKTGGRKPGSKNKPKPAAPVDTPVAAGVATAAAGGARDAPSISLPRARGGDLPPSRKERVDRLIPFEGNARTHSKASIDKLAGLIKRVGWTSPMLVAGRQILAGHARRLAAIKLGIEIVPVIDLKHLTRAEQEAVILSDNRIALEGGWDTGNLLEAFERLKDGGLDFAVTAFDPREISNLFGAVEQPKPAPVRRTEKFVECPQCHHEFTP